MNRRRSYSFYILCTATLCSLPFALRAETAALQNINAIPEEFRDLAAPQMTLADFYYGGRYITSATVTYTPETVTLANPEDLVKRINNIARPRAVQQALTGELNSNPDKICLNMRDSGCGDLAPDIAGIIFDESRFRADVFIAEPYLVTTTALQSKYLPPANSALGMVQGLSATTSGTTGTENGQENYSLFGNTLIGWNENHLISDWDYSKDNHFSVDTLYVERDTQGMQLGAGYLNSSSVMTPEFSGSYNLLGVKAGTSMNSRLDTAAINATPIQVFSNGPRRIEVLRDDRLIYATSVQAGSHQLDTRSFPEGAYTITVRIFNGGALEREYTQFYVKSISLPPTDELLWYVEGGDMTERSDNTIPETLGEWMVRGGVGFRIAENSALHLRSSLTDDIQTGEAELYHLGTGWDVSGTVMVGSQSAKGAAFDTSTSLGPVYLSYYYRQLWNDEYEQNNTEANTNLLSAGYKSHSVSASTQFLGGSLSGSYSYNKNDDQDKQTISSIRWFRTLWQQGNYDLDFDLDFSRSENDQVITAGLTLRQNTRSWNYSVGISHEQQEYNDSDTKENSTLYNLDSRWYQDEMWGGSADFGLRYAHLRDSDTIGTDINYETARFGAELSADHYRPEARERDNYTSYTARFDTSFAMNADHASLGGSRRDDSAVIIDIKGSEDAQFDVLVNGGTTGLAAGDSSTVVPLSPYGTYAISIRPRGDQFFKYDQSEKTITLYPGNVQTLSFQSEDQLVLLGKLVDSLGESIESATIRGEDVFSRTDQFGIFQIQVPVGMQQFDVELADNSSCKLVLPEEYQKRNGVGLVGELTCTAQ